MDYLLHPAGIIRSPIKERSEAPRQGYKGAPAVTIEIDSPVMPALSGLAAGDEIVVLTWLHKSNRETLQVHRRGDQEMPLTGVFATRSPDRPNPIGLHPVRILRITDNTLEVAPMEAIDGTPVLDIKPFLRSDRQLPGNFA